MLPIRRANDIAVQQKRKNIGLIENNLLSLSYGRIKKKDIDTSFGLLPESFETYQIVEAGNIILRLTDLQNDQRSLRVGLAKERGIITSAYLCLRFLRNVHPVFAYYLLFVYDISKVFYWFGGGLRQSMKFDDIKVFPFVLPPLSEQKAIAHYLDTKTAQIDRKIDLLTQKATLYSNLKQSLINETVTRGLDKTVPMKDSGIDAIGKVPKHWEVKRLKDLFDIQNSNVDKKLHDNEIPVKLCNYVDVYKNEFINALLDFTDATASKFEIKQFAIKKGDVFITKDSETCDDIAIPALATESLNNVLCGYHLARLRAKEKVFLGSYLFRLFQSQSYGFRFVISAKGITRVGLGQSAIADPLTPVPPISEQTAIADYLDTKTAQIDQIIQTINTQIERLKELRKTLINDVVTGKIKVVENEY